jgi:radical SAM superfamily enzyme YgiQ (UPF0313 family)
LGFRRWPRSPPQLCSGRSFPTRADANARAYERGRRDARRVCYWDENLLQGPPPVKPLPRVVGITVHLTFARRADELAGWFRKHGSIVVLGGLHVLSCPDEAAAHADALAIGDGVQIWPEVLADVEQGSLKPRYGAGFERSYDADPPPRRDLLPKRSFLTTTSLIATRGCHNLG